MSGNSSDPANFDDLFADLDLGDDKAPAAGVHGAGEAVSEAPPKRRGRPRTVVSDDAPEDPPVVETAPAVIEPSKVEIITPEKTQILPPVSPQTLLEMQCGADYLRKRGAI